MSGKRFWIMAALLSIAVWITRSQVEKFLHSQNSVSAGKTDNLPAVRQDIALTVESDGKVLATNLAGKALLINFWASWCAPCMAEMPSIYGLRDKYKQQNFEVVAVNLDVRVEDGVRALQKKFGEPPFPILVGHGTPLAEKFNIEGVPHTLLVDRKGKIRYSLVGERNWLDAEATRLVESIL